MVVSSLSVATVIMIMKGYKGHQEFSLESVYLSSRVLCSLIKSLCS